MAFAQDRWPSLVESPKDHLSKRPSLSPSIPVLLYALRWCPESSFSGSPCLSRLYYQPYGHPSQCLEPHPLPPLGTNHCLQKIASCGDHWYQTSAARSSRPGFSHLFLLLHFGLHQDDLQAVVIHILNKTRLPLLSFVLSVLCCRTVSKGLVKVGFSHRLIYSQPKHSSAWQLYQAF